MPRTRRHLLQSLGGGLSVALSGCLYGPLFDSGEPFDPKDHVEDWHPEPVEAQGEPIEVNRCGIDAVDEIKTAVHDRANAQESIQAGYTKSEEMPDWYLYVNRVIVVGPSGDVQELPKVSFETIVNATPDSVVKAIDDGQDVMCPEEVYVYDRVQYMD